MGKNSDSNSQYGRSISVIQKKKGTAHVWSEFRSIIDIEVSMLQLKYDWPRIGTSSNHECPVTRLEQ